MGLRLKGGCSGLGFKPALAFKRGDGEGLGFRVEGCVRRAGSLGFCGVPLSCGFRLTWTPKPLSTPNALAVP